MSARLPCKTALTGRWKPAILCVHAMLLVPHRKTPWGGNAARCSRTDRPAFTLSSSYSSCQPAVAMAV